MDEQQNVIRPDGEEPSQDQRGIISTRRRREPSMKKVAERIAVRLRAFEVTARARIRQAVLDLGRTQAWTLAMEALSAPESDEEQTPVDRFISLVETKGIKKERPAHIQQTIVEQLSSDPLKDRETTNLIAQQLGEQEETAWQTIHRCVKMLGIEATLVLLQKTQEIEASGGMLLPDQSRRKTPGGVFFWLVRKEVTVAQRGKIFRYGTPKPVSEPQQAAPKQAKPRSQSVASLPWAERVQACEEAEAERGEIRTVKITLVGRPGKIVEEGRCVVVSMQQAAKLPPLPAGLPLPSVELVGATRYTVYIANKQWKKVAEAIKDAEDILIIEGLPVLDGERIAVLASNVTTRNLQKAPRTHKPQKARGTNAVEPEAAGQADRVQ